MQAALWLCEDYPLSLADQIMPIIDLMAISSTHFAKLRDFIQMQLPAGFPTKIGKPHSQISIDLFEFYFENGHLFVAVIISDLKSFNFGVIRVNKAHLFIYGFLFVRP